MEHDSASGLPIFAYGTLKQGFRNHAAYCKGALEVHAAETWGRLFLWQESVPILQVADTSILLMGSKDVSADLEAARAQEAPARLAKPRGRGWRRIQGELIVFPDPEARLALLDAFEGFRPMPASRSYERVLLSVGVHASRWSTKRVQTAWAYVHPPLQDLPDTPLDVDVWHPGMDA